MWCWRVLVSLTTCLLYFQSVDAIKCYQCSSSVDVHCTENINVDDTNLALEDCSSIHDAQYCVKTTGIFNGEVGTTRFCSSQNLGHICDFQKRMGDVRAYRGCIYTCSHDGCNAGPGAVTPSHILLTTLLITAGLSYFKLSF